MAINPWKVSLTHALNPASPISLALSPDGKSLAVGCQQGEIQFLDAETFTEKGSIALGKVQVSWLGFVQTGLAAQFGENTLFLYSLDHFQRKAAFSHSRVITAAAAHTDRVFFADAKGTITALDLVFKIYQSVITSESFKALLATHEHLWAGNQLGEIYRFRKSSLQCENIIATPSSSPISLLRLFPTGIAAYKRDETLLVWGFTEKKILSTRIIPRSDTNDIVVAGHEMITAGTGAILCDRPLHKNVCRIEAHENTNVQALVYSLALNRLFTIGQNRQIASWQRQLTRDALHISV